MRDVEKEAAQAQNPQGHTREEGMPTMSAMDLTQAIALVEKLSSEEKLQLIEHLAHELQQKPQPTPRLSWKDARGLGKEIWQGIDTQVYIDKLRDEWDR